MSSILNKTLTRTIKSKMSNLGYKYIDYYFQREEVNYEELVFSTVTFAYTSFLKKGCILVNVRVGVSIPEVEIIKKYLYNLPLGCGITHNEALGQYLNISYPECEYEFSLDSDIDSSVEQMIYELPPIITSFVNSYHTIDSIFEVYQPGGRGMYFHRGSIIPAILFLRGEGLKGLSYLESLDNEDMVPGGNKTAAIARYKDLITGTVKIDIESEVAKWRKKLSKMNG